MSNTATIIQLSTNSVYPSSVIPCWQQLHQRIVDGELSSKELTRSFNLVWGYAMESFGQVFQRRNQDELKQLYCGVLAAIAQHPDFDSEPSIEKMVRTAQTQSNTINKATFPYKHAADAMEAVFINLPEDTYAHVWPNVKKMISAIYSDLFYQVEATRLQQTLEKAVAVTGTHKPRKL